VLQLLRIILRIPHTRIKPMQTNANTSSLSQEAQTLASRARWSNNAYIGFLVLTLAATVLIVRYNNRLNKVKDELAVGEKLASEEKVAALTRDAEIAKKERAETDLKAEAARERAGKADERAGEANERAGQVEKANLALRGQVATLETKAADAIAAQLRMEQSLEATKAQTIEALTRANEANFTAFKEKWEREQAEMFSYPRKLNTYRERGYVDKLRKYAGTEVMLITLPDTEPTRTAQMIADLLDQAGWRVLGIEQRQGTSQFEIRDGVDIELDGLVGPGPQQSPLTPAIEALRDVLSDSDITVQRSGLNPRLPPAKLPPNTVRVVVGLRPDWTPLIKKMQKEANEDRVRRMYDRPAGPPTPPKPE
jgi:hypothetical protein